MDKEKLFKLVKEKYGTLPDYPWSDENAVLRHKDNGKWYGLIMEVGKDKLGLAGTEKVDVLNVKCDPLLTVSLRKKAGILPAYHMNKEKWITILLDGSVPEEEILSLLALSYKLTASEKKKNKENKEKSAGKGARKE